MRILLLIFVGVSMVSYSQNEIQYDHQLADLYQLMQGTFNSHQQSLKDSSFYDITLHMYPIWQVNQYYLYVEQSVSSMQDQPYRQRVYQLKRTSDSTITSFIYKLPNDSLWVGLWKRPVSSIGLSPADLIPLNGCEVTLTRKRKNYFVGSTSENSCQSTLHGARYAHSEVEISPGTIYSWDKGLDAKGNQIWGAIKGGYIFKKIKE